MCVSAYSVHVSLCAWMCSIQGDIFFVSNVKGVPYHAEILKMSGVDDKQKITSFFNIAEKIIPVQSNIIKTESIYARALERKLKDFEHDSYDKQSAGGSKVFLVESGKSFRFNFYLKFLRIKRP